MNKKIFFRLTLALATVLAASCQSDEKQLLEAKVYFETTEFRLEVSDQESMNYDLKARLSKMLPGTTELTYELADTSAVEAYNKRNGTNHQAFDLKNVSLKTNKTTIPGGALYAESRQLELKNLKTLEEGKPFLLPIKIASAGQPIIQGSDIIYLLLTKPLRILTAGELNNNAITVPTAPNHEFKSLTYEALINLNYFGGNNTILGKEGTLIFRIGDRDGGLATNLIQIAGNKQFHSAQPLEKNRWYHVAFSYEQPTGKAIIYINGNKVAEGSWDTPSFDLSGGPGFHIGKVDGFMWGERPFYGKMAEVRIWNVARTENQIRNNMLSVDPASEGLFAYYKLNGGDIVQKEDGKWYVKDASKNGLDALSNRGWSAIDIANLDSPIQIQQ